MFANPWLLLVTLSLVWGCSFAFMELGLRDLTPLEIVWMRLTGAALFLLPVIALTGRRLPRVWSFWLMGAAMSFLNNSIPFFLIATGQQSISAAMASIVNATTPLWTMLLAHLMTRDDRLTPIKSLGVAVGFAGVVVLLGPSNLLDMSNSVWGQLAVLSAAFSYGIAFHFARRFAGYDPLVVSGSILMLGGIMLLPGVLYGLSQTGWFATRHVQSSTWIAMAAAAVFSTGIAYVMYYRLSQIASSTFNSTVTFLVPMVAILIDWAVFGEVLSLRSLTGMLIVFAGIVIVRKGTAMATAKR